MGFLSMSSRYHVLNFFPKYGYLIDSLRNGGHQSRKERISHSTSKAYLAAIFFCLVWENREAIQTYFTSFLRIVVCKNLPKRFCNVNNDRPGKTVCLFCNFSSKFCAKKLSTQCVDLILNFLLSFYPHHEIFILKRPKDHNSKG